MALQTRDKILYHFTEATHVAAIRSHGINPSPLSIPRGGATIAMVSLTTNPNPRNLIGKSLTDGSYLSGKNLEAYRRQIGNPSAPAPPTRRTCECRIKLRIPENDPLLKKLDAAAVSLGFDNETLAEFIQLGGGHSAAWWVYDGTLPSRYIDEVYCGYPKFKTVA